MRAFFSGLWIGIAVFLAVFLTLVYFMWSVDSAGGAEEEFTAPTIYCKAGAAYCDGTSAAEVIIGSSGYDKIRGFGGNDYIAGNGGSDTILAGGGADKAIGGPGNDTITGGYGWDQFIGNDGADKFYMRDCDNEPADGGPGIDRAISDRTDWYVSVEYPSEAWCV